MKIIIIILVLLMSCSTIGASEQSEYDTANDIWYNGQPKKAISLLREFIKKYPKSNLADDAQSLIGTAFGNLNQYERAISEYRKVAKNYPTSNMAALSIYNMAHTYYYSIADFDSAKACYKRFIQTAHSSSDDKWVNIAKEQLADWPSEKKQTKEKNSFKSTSSIRVDGKKISFGMLADSVFPILNEYKRSEPKTTQIWDYTLTVTHYYAFDNGKILVNITFERDDENGPYKISGIERKVLK